MATEEEMAAAGAAATDTAPLPVIRPTSASTSGKAN